MTLPTFLGIGVMRGGTTWLYELLMSHPEIFVPTKRKEIHYFTINYHNGLNWYESFFPNNIEGKKYKAIGEVSPSYFYLSDLNRIESIETIEKFILILRNPVHRAYSYYGLYQRDRNYTKSFEEFLDAKPPAIENGFYSKYLRNYFQYFNRKQILILIHEEAVKNVTQTKVEISAFLGISYEKFSIEAGMARVNQSHLPQRAFAYSLAPRMSRKLRDKNLDAIVNLGKAVGFKGLFGERKSPTSMKKSTYQDLTKLYDPEIETLEKILQVSLACWRENDARNSLTQEQESDD